MRKIKRILGSVAMMAMLGSTVAIGGCAVRVYDPGHSDYHRWNHQEEVYYEQWEHDSHRGHKNFRDRDADEQSQYWNWRHQHGGGH
jgi:hypothetical protein